MVRVPARAETPLSVNGTYNLLSSFIQFENRQIILQHNNCNAI